MSDETSKREAPSGKSPADRGKRIILAIIIVAVVGVTLLQLRSPGLDKRWGSDLATAQATARTGRRPVIVVLHDNPPSPTARRFMEKSLGLPVTGEALDKGQWLCVKLTLPEGLQSAKAKEFKLTSLPAVVLLAPDGREIGRGYGFIGHAELERMMHQARVKAGLEAGPTGS